MKPKVDNRLANRAVEEEVDDGGIPDPPVGFAGLNEGEGAGAQASG